MTSNEILSCTPNEDVVTKSMYRFKVWNLLENKDLVRFPRPCKGRIPNFVDCVVAAEKLSALDIFKKAEIIKVNIDKPQESVRFTVLEEGKTLLVPMPGLTDGLVMKVTPPRDASRPLLRMACKRRGASDFGKPIDLNEKIQVDMIVLGSVAVSKEGHRIGKGEGFSDLEYAVMAACGTVTEDTVIVTTVHDEQIFDKLPHELFQPFDVPVDFIVTPTQVIEVTPRLPKPKGILWNVLSDRRLQLIPMLKTLRDKDMKSGKDCTLKEVDSEPEERTRPYYRPSLPRRRMYVPPRRPSQESRNNSPQGRRTRTFRRGGSQRKQGPRDQREQRGGKFDRKMNGENKENLQQQSRQKPIRRVQRRFYKNRLPVDFSVKVGNIGSAVRVRDLKAALNEKGVRPREITWKGARGFALLHFAKMKAQPEQPTAVDDVIASLQGLTVKCKREAEIQETLLSVEPAKPISRIENAGVTSV
ncbi:methenyltetrahydrofolate synthase domain-containing protein isoform X2 [Homalodisca vitripennis]|uniref:methenyltetrahydrofolate synthase domain-containing protein isoform X2 n=1 Tax=Homalodisca vitripennis TaxID=197043 RepID=UPI001EEAF0FC|nr:methenyltetrahydrofolate synthase domain-containing protein isoform X2 [Homalodisca vitripennis]